MASYDSNLVFLIYCNNQKRGRGGSFAPYSFIKTLCPKRKQQKLCQLAPHPQHDAVLDVEQDLFLLSVVSDEGVQRVTVGHPAN